MTDIAIYVRPSFVTEAFRDMCADPPLGAIVALPADLVVSQGVTVKPKKPSASDRRSLG
jgi:thiamine pyrophosphate-dependent acetolactate synthase large subunit-like protein